MSNALSRTTETPAAPAVDEAALPAGAADYGPPATVGVAAATNAVVNWFVDRMTFWNVVPLIGLVAMAYLYLFTDSLYDSQTIVNLQNGSSSSASLTSLSSSLLGSSSTSSQSGAVLAYITSPDLLRILDKQFHLRALYSSPDRSIFARLDEDASNEDFLNFYQQMVTVSQDTTTLLITIDVLDYDANRAQAISKAVLADTQNFVNAMSAVQAQATIKFADDQLKAAYKAVETAQPYERAVAETELTAAQQAMAAAQGIANQQQSFLIGVTGPTLPTDTTVPDRLVDEAGILLGAAVLFLIAQLLLANVRDHRKL